MRDDHLEINLERHIEKKISRFLERLEPRSRRNDAENVCKFVTRHVNYPELQRGIVHKFNRDVRRGKNPNIYFLNEKMNVVLRKIQREVRGRDQFSETYVVELGGQLVLSLRSICRFFDPLAKCWKRA